MMIVVTHFYFGAWHKQKKNQKKGKEKIQKKFEKVERKQKNIYKWEKYTRTLRKSPKIGWWGSNIQGWKIWQCVFDQ